MARMTIGARIRQVLGRGSTNSAGPSIGNQVITNEGTVLGTITAIWKGADATDHAPHEDTLYVQRPDQEATSPLYVPAGAIARMSDQGVVLAVDGAQAIARGWRFRPGWLPQDDPGTTATATKA